MQRSSRLSIPLDGPWHTFDATAGSEASTLARAIPEAAVTCPAPGYIFGSGSKHTTESWYFCPFDLPAIHPHWELLLQMSAPAEIWLNGAKAGTIENAFTPAEFVITSLLQSTGNVLAIRCMNSAPRPEYEPFLGPCMLEGRHREHIDSWKLDCSARKKRATLSVEAPDSEKLRLSTGWEPHGSQESGARYRHELHHLEAWSTENPVRHTFRIDYAASEEQDSLELEFAYSEFNERAGKLYLNGRHIFIKGLRYAPFYPDSLHGTSLADRCQADIKIIQGLGFNAVLCDGVPPLSLMEAAETAGLIIGIDLSDLAVADFPINAVVDQFRTYGCLGFWRLVHDDPAIAESLRVADPKHMILHLNKTTWQARMSRAYQENWEPYEDLEIFLPAPADYRAENYCRHVGSTQSLSLVTAFGLEAPGSPWVTPKAPCEGYASALDEAFEERALGRVFSDPAAFVRATTTPQCDLARLQIDAFRGNPNLSGYFYDCFADLHCMDSRGILDNQRSAKLVADTLKVVQRPIRPLIQMSSTNLAPRAEVAVTVLMANELRLEDRADLVLLVVGPTNQVLWKKRRSVKIVKHGKELWSGAVAASGSTGPHRLVVRIMRGAEVAAEGMQDFLVVAPPEKSPVRAHVLEHRKRWSATIHQWSGIGTILSPIHIIPPLANTIRAYPDHELLQVLAQVKGGALGVVIEPPTDWNDFAEQLDPELCLDQMQLGEDISHAFQFAKIHPLFEGLPNRNVLRQAYRQLAPRRLFVGESIDDSSGAWIPTLETNGDRGRCTFANGITTKRYGAGRLLFLNYRMLEGLGDDPLAARFFTNLLTFAERRSVPPSYPLRLEKAPAEWIRSRRIHETRQWAVLGVFPNDEHHGHDEAYAPELGIQLEEQYPGAYEVIRWRRWNTLDQEHHLLDLDRALSPLRGSPPAWDHGTAYAYAEFQSDQRHGAKLVFKSPNKLKIWMNGTLHFASTDINAKQQEVDAYVKLGKNTLLVKCSKGPGPFGFDLDIFPENRATLHITWWRM